MTGLLKAYVAIIAFSRRIDKRFANFFQSSLVLSIACTFARILYVPKRFSSIFRPRFPTQRPLFYPFASAKTARSTNRVPSMRTALIFLTRSALFTVFALLASRFPFLPFPSLPYIAAPLGALFPRSVVRPAQSLRRRTTGKKAAVHAAARQLHTMEYGICRIFYPRISMYDMNCCSCGCPFLRAIGNLFSTDFFCCCGKTPRRTGTSCRTSSCCSSCRSCCNGCNSCNHSSESEQSSVCGGFGSCSSLWCCSDAYYARQYGLNNTTSCSCARSSGCGCCR